MARLPNFLVIIRSEKLSGKGQGRGGRGAKKRTFRFGKKNVSFPKVETFRFADYILATTDKLTENLIYEKELIEIPRDHDKLKILYYIEVQQNRIRKEAYEYFKNIQRNIEQTGSIFSPIPTEVRGNIVCVSDPKEWVLGYVDVTSTTIMKRFMPELRDFYETSYDCAKNILTGMAPDGYTYYIYSGAPTVPNRYAPFRCVDCTYDGRGTKNKPSWWPTDHL